MTDIFASLADTATRLLTAYGQEVTFRANSEQVAADPNKPWKPNVKDYYDYTVRIVFVSDTRRGYEPQRLRDGSEVPKGNSVGIMAAQTFTPNLRDSIIRGGVTYGICTIEPIAPNGTVVAYKLGLDK
jgi:hypothetical protein